MRGSTKIISGLKLAVVLVGAIFILTSSFTFMQIVLISNPNKEQNIPGMFYSHNVDDNFQIYVALPSNYNPSDLKRYPVIYLLDGDWYFDGSHWRISKGGVKGIISRYAEAGDMPEAILVAIGYPVKNFLERDYLYPADPWFVINSGGGLKFYSFIKDELIPKVDAEFKTNNTYGRTIISRVEKISSTTSGCRRTSNRDPSQNFPPPDGSGRKVTLCSGRDGKVTILFLSFDAARIPTITTLIKGHSGFCTEANN